MPLVGRVLHVRVLRPSWTPAGGEASCEGFEGPILRYLAARAFASWVAIQGPGLRTTVRALQAALVVVRREAGRVSGGGARALDASLMKEAFRQADLRLVHLASPEALAAALGALRDGRRLTKRPIVLFWDRGQG